MRTRSVFVLALVAMLCAWPVSGQEQVGSISGQVTDAEGGVLPGATVEVSGTGIGTLVATTDERGFYRFPRVPPGVYAVSVSLQSFQPAESTGVNVTLGQATTVDFELQVGEFTEEIVVTGERAQIDVRQSGTAVSIAREQIELIPRGRDFSDVVAQAPGANNETFLGGISIDGASGSENRYVIDGIDTTNPDSGVQGQELRADFVEEVQVKSAGYDAEYGGSVGGVINVVTKSGTNEFQGSVGVDYQDSSWSGDERPTPTEDSLVTCGRDDLLCVFDKDDETQLEPAFTLGGPLFRDKAWFFVGYQNSSEEIERSPLGAERTSDREVTRQTFVGNIKGNVGSGFLYRVAANMSPRDEEGVLPARDGSTPAEANLGIDSDLPRESYSAYADFVPSSNFYLSGRAGYYLRDVEDQGLTDTTRFLFNAGSPPLPESDPRFEPAGFSSVPSDSFNGNLEDKWERLAGSLDANYFVRAGGEHSFKAGVQTENVENNVSTGENGNLYIIRWGAPDRLGLGVQGSLGSVEVRRFRTEGSAESENLGLYLQDSWAVLPNLTLNLGVRGEQEKIPNYPVNQPLYGEYAIEFDFDDKVAPRLGFAWDVLSDQRWKVYGSYGTYYDITKLQMPRGSFGADRWISYVYPLETLNWETLDDSCHISTNDFNDNVCPGLGPSTNIDLRRPSNPAESIDPDLKPMEQREWQIGLEHQLSPNIVLGARFVNKELQETIEDIGFRVFNEDGTSFESFIIGNPGKGVVGGDPPGPLPAQPEAVRDYQGLTLSFDRRFVDNWSVRASYTYSDLTGNYSGLASSDEFGRTDPNVERYFDALHNAFDASGNQVNDGPLNTDRPNQFEVQALYRAPWGTVLGLNQYWGEGAPLSEQVNYIGVEFFPHGRENLGRLDDLTQTDLSITHPFQIGRYELELNLNVLNLFDEDTVTRVGTDHYREDLCDRMPGCDGTQEFFFSNTPINVDAIMDGAEVDPFYLRPFGSDTVPAFQRPREVRLGATFRF